VLKQGQFSLDNEACVEYEALRDYALGTARDAAIPQGFTLVIQRGLLAWLESKKALNLTHEFRSEPPSRSSANDEIVLVLANMVLQSYALERCIAGV
jgi:hypothetical protein